MLDQLQRVFVPSLPETACCASCYSVISSSALTLRTCREFTAPFLRLERPDAADTTDLATKPKHASSCRGSLDFLFGAGMDDTEHASAKF